MKRNKGKRFLSILLTLLLVFSSIPISPNSHVHGGYEDGQDCIHCGEYRYDDWLCDGCGGCSEIASGSCYSENHCPDCGNCVEFGLDHCADCLRCDECIAICYNCELCFDCGAYGIDYMCDGCDQCASCIQGPVCSDCDQCAGCTGGNNCARDSCNLCESCYDTVCPDCGLCSYCLGDLYCPDCSLCVFCSPQSCIHCYKDVDCVTICSICDEICAECAVYFCHGCDRCSDCADICVGCGETCADCAEDFCDFCIQCSDCTEICPGCGNYCRECSYPFCYGCKQCFECVDVCIDCGDHCSECADDFCDTCQECSECTDVCNGCGESCIKCADSFCPRCKLCSDCADVCVSCGDTCSECIDLCGDCGTCSECATICGNCGNSCSDCGKICVSCGDYCSECAIITPTYNECEYCIDICVLCNVYCEYDSAICEDCGKCDFCSGMFDEYKYNKYSHWHECSCGWIYYFIDNHILTEWDIITPATASEDGLKSRKCKECDYIESKVIPKDHTHIESEWIIDKVAGSRTDGSKHKECIICHEILETARIRATGASHTHKWSEKYSKNENYHWHECPCGAKQASAMHSFSDWIIDKAATETSEGSRHKECTVCGYIAFAEVTPVLEHTHTWSSKWSSDKTNHWHECSCGEKKDNAKHTESGWIVDKKATSTADGSKHKECTVCKYVIATEVIPATGNEHIHAWSSKWSSDKTNHWHECSCGEKKDNAKHTESGWIVDKKATATANGSKHKECTVCKYVIATEVIPKEDTNANENEKIILKDTDEYLPINTSDLPQAILVKPDFKANEIIALAVNNGLILKDKDGKELKSDELVGSGATLNLIKDGKLIDSYTIVVLGDTNGDGKITSADARFALRMSARLENPKAWQFVAAARTNNINEQPEKISSSMARKILRVAARLEEF